MGEFFDLMVAFNITGNIQSVIIGNAELISITVKNIFRIVKGIAPDGISHWPTGLVQKIGGKAKPPRQLIIQHRTKIMGLVIIRWKKFAVIDTFFAEITIEFYFGARVGVSEPSV